MEQLTVEINPKGELELAQIRQLLSANNEFEIKEMGSDIIISKQTNGKVSETKLHKPITLNSIIRDITQLAYMDAFHYLGETFTAEVTLLREKNKQYFLFANKFIPDEIKKDLLDNQNDYFTEKGRVLLNEILGHKIKVNIDKSETYKPKYNEVLQTENEAQKLNTLHQSVKDAGFPFQFCLIHEKNHLLYRKFILRYYDQNIKIKGKDCIRICDKIRYRNGSNYQNGRGELRDGKFVPNDKGDYILRDEYFLFHHGIVEHKKWWFILRYGIIGYNDGVWVEKGILPYFKNKLRQFKSSLNY